jgi:hypothetical protein
MMNGIGKTQLIDDHFQSQHSGKCDLLLQLTSSRISYALFDKARDTIKAVFDAPITQENDLRGFLTNDPLLNAHFHKVKISLQTFKFTFVPSDVYDEGSLNHYNKFIQAAPSTLSVSHILTQEIENIAAFDAETKSTLDSKFQHYCSVSSANPLIEAAAKIYNDSKQLILNFTDNSFEALLLDEGKLIFYNIFTIQTAEDFNYFLLLVLQELQIDPKITVPVVCGQIDTTNENYHRLQKYFSIISFADIGLLINPSPVLEQIPSHRFFSLIGLNLCE